MNGYTTIIRIQFQQSRAHHFTNTYSSQVHKQTRLFLEHDMCLDNSNMCGTNSFISEAVASDAYKHIITTRIMNIEVFNNNNWRWKTTTTTTTTTCV